MKKLLTGKESKKVDEYCINELKIPSMVLMERAALSVVEELMNMRNNNENIKIVCSSGNNGADGLAVARILSEKGIVTKVYIVSDMKKVSEDFEKQLQLLKHTKTIIYYKDDLNESFRLDDSADIIVDALFGIGLSRDVIGEYERIINMINNSGTKVISVDIPSGLNADNGEIMGVSVNADLTVTFGTCKSGMFLCDGRNVCGDIKVKQIGFLQEAYDSVELHENNKYMYTYEINDLQRIPKRTPVSNKGSYGKTGVIAGNSNMSGAAYMAAKAAYRTGCGIVKIYTHTNNKSILKTMLPEAIITSTDDLDEAYECDSYLIGPGIGTKCEDGFNQADMIKKVLESGKPTVIDADALNVISERKDLLSLFHENVIITPHVKEMSRLSGKSVDYIRKNIIITAKGFSKEYGCVTVIKDASTIVSSPDGEIFINSTGNSGMATGGSGDVLSGITASMLCKNISAFESAKLSVYIHGCAGDITASEYSEYSMMAGDIIDKISDVLMIVK